MHLKTTLPVSVSAPEPSTLNSQPSTSSYCLDFIASDSTTDRYCESIDARGWKLDNYKKNPVFQNSHQYGDILFTLGKALVTEVRQSTINNQPSTFLYQRIAFACDINPMAKIAYGLYKGGFLSGVSVGFIPLKWQDVPSNSQPSTTNPQPRRSYLEQELLEVSAVAIPANPNALALAYKSGAVEKSDLRELSQLLECTLTAASSDGSKIPEASSSGYQQSAIHYPRAAEPSHLHFLRTLHAILRKT